MILISYDISNTKLRTRFSKYIRRFGHMVQYSVYEIDNGDKVLSNIVSDIEYNWSSKFGETDSVMVIVTSKTCKVLKFGYAKHEDEDVIII